MTDVEQIDAELDAYVVGDLVDEYDPDTEPRTLADIDEADRGLWRMRRIEVEMQRTERLFDARISQMQERRDEVLGVMRREHEWWSRRVEMWARAHRDEVGGKAKTIRLPSGSVSFRAPSERVETIAKTPGEDVPAEFVRVSRAWDKQAIKAATMPGPEAEDFPVADGHVARYAVTADGEVLGDVVRVSAAQDTVSIKAGA